MAISPHMARVPGNQPPVLPVAAEQINDFLRGEVPSNLGSSMTVVLWSL
ncbi:MAG: hypothetical protein JO287_17345 [Pseudonocardiales bacterium]|nr:hypothetical protein [Pseudonocardiales bacterium]